MSINNLLSFLSADGCMLVATEINDWCRMDILIVTTAEVAVKLVIIVLVLAHGRGRHTDYTCTCLKLLVLGVLVVRVGIDCILGVHTELRIESAAS